MMIGQVRVANVQQEALDSETSTFLNYHEEQRISLLDSRIARRKIILADDVKERRKIIARAIKRRRRAQGKT